MNQETQGGQSAEEESAESGAYWKANLNLVGVLMAIWFAVGLGAGVLFRPFLDQFHIGGYPLGFWFAQQGSIYVFIALIFIYSALVHRIERKHRVDDDDAAEGLDAP